jgi:hypothetical protein
LAETCRSLITRRWAVLSSISDPRSFQRRRRFPTALRSPSGTTVAIARLTPRRDDGGDRRRASCPRR